MYTHLIIQTLWKRDCVDTNTHTCVCLYMNSTPPSQVRCDPRLLLKCNTSSLVSAFSFSKTGCYSDIKEPCQTN